MSVASTLLGVHYDRVIAQNTWAIGVGLAPRSVTTVVYWSVEALLHVTLDVVVTYGGEVNVCSYRFLGSVLFDARRYQELARHFDAVLAEDGGETSARRLIAALVVYTTTTVLGGALSGEQVLNSVLTSRTRTPGSPPAGPAERFTIAQSERRSLMSAEAAAATVVVVAAAAATAHVPADVNFLDDFMSSLPYSCGMYRVCNHLNGGDGNDDDNDEDTAAGSLPPPPEGALLASVVNPWDAVGAAEEPLSPQPPPKRQAKWGVRVYSNNGVLASAPISDDDD